MKLPPSNILALYANSAKLKTSFALSYTVIKIENNFFKTGEIKINLNDGKAIIDENDPLFEPGMTVEKEFFIKNGGGEPIYYKLNFTGVSGELSKAIEVKILDKNRLELVSGKVYEFENDKELREYRYPSSFDPAPALVYLIKSDKLGILP